MQLGKVKDEKYDVALKVAAGARLQYMVVSSVNDAAKSIEYLRKKKIGRCTFLPLNKINVKTQEKAPKESIGFARDYIQHSAKFAKVFDYVFGDTIIVRNLETAKKIGIGHWRMVTLDGDLLELSGAITGGHIGERVEVTFSIIDELEDEIKTLESKVTSFESEYNNKLTDTRKLESKLQVMRERLRKSKEAIDSFGFERTLATERRTSLREQLNKVVEAVASLDREIQENSIAATKLEKTVSADEKKLAEVAERRNQGTVTKLDTLKDSLRDLEVEKTKLTEKIGFLKQQSRVLSSRLEEIASSTTVITNEMGSLQKKITGLKSSLEGLEREHKSVGGEIKDILDERDEIEAQLTDLSSKVGEMEHGMEGASEQLSNFSIEKAKISTRLEDLRREYSKYDGVELIDKPVKDLEPLAEKLEADLVAFGSVNMRSIETYDVIKKEYDEINEKLETLKKERQSIFDFMDKIEGKKRDIFMEAFEKVKSNFERIYGQLSEGKGTLSLDNPMNISESGLIITASPGGKKLMSLDAMSGGEKVVTSSAFLMSLQQYKPAFFYVVDELDAALDKPNSVRLAEILAASSSQFLMVTHNNNMLNYMDSAIGVSMIQGASQIVGVRFNGEQTSENPEEDNVTRHTAA